MRDVSSFTGHIAGLGTASGVRLVLGLWDVTPFGPITDAMVEEPDGSRTLVAPSKEVAEYIASTYSFDDLVVGTVDRPSSWQLSSEILQVGFSPGNRLAVAWPLRAVPAGVRRRPGWARLCDPIARVAMPGVRTYGTAGNGRTEWYAATDARRIVSASARWRGRDLGALAPIDPPVRFGFASAPRQPTLTALTSYVREA